MIAPWEEEWTDVLGYEGNYWVSSQGRVLSRPRHRSTGGLIKINVNSSGYAIVSLSQNNVVKTPSVHSLVMSAFMGPRPLGLQTCHRNGDPLDPALHNLRYDTPAANQADRLQHGTDLRSLRSSCPAGHEFTKESTYYSPDGRRSCRKCRQLRAAAVDDMRKAARRARGLKYSQPLSEQQRDEVKTRHATGESQSSLARRFGTSRRTIYRIILTD